MGGAVEEAVARVLASTRFIGGPEIDRFESSFADYCGAAHCVGVANGTDALTVALRALGIGPGDEVIVPSMTFIATAESAVLVGADPVIVDVDITTGLMSYDAAAAAIGPRTAAIVAVHLWGQCVDLTRFRELADRHSLVFIEDAAQAHGARFGSARAGSVGDIGCFSFFPGKNLGAVGDAGGIVTSDEAIASAARRIRDHGRDGKYLHGIIGTNARLDPLHAAVLSEKLPYLDGWNQRRRENAAAFDAAFGPIPDVELIHQAPEAESVFHQYVVRVQERDGFQEAMAASGVATGVHYPIPLHQQPSLAPWCADVDAPAADEMGRTVVSLPVDPCLSASDRDYVIETASPIMQGTGAPT